MISRASWEAMLSKVLMAMLILALSGFVTKGRKQEVENTASIEFTVHQYGELILSRAFEKIMYTGTFLKYPWTHSFK